MIVHERPTKLGDDKSSHGAESNEPVGSGHGSGGCGAHSNRFITSFIRPSKKACLKGSWDAV